MINRLKNINSFMTSEITISNSNIDLFNFIFLELGKYENITTKLSLNNFFFKRRKFSSSDVGDKMGMYRRIQYSGSCSINEDVIQIQINFKTQFYLIIISLIPPLFLFLILYPSINIIFLICSYFVLSFCWYLISKKMIINRFISIITSYNLNRRKTPY